MIRPRENEPSSDYVNRLIAYGRQEYIVEYAYPTSITAGKAGMSATGCYYVSKRINGGQSPRKVILESAAHTETEAQAAADLLNGGKHD
jgi:hypothetical protein